MNVRKDETAGGVGYSNNEKEKKNSSYLYAKRSGLQTAKSSREVKEQLCALGGLGGQVRATCPARTPSEPCSE